MKKSTITTIEEYFYFKKEDFENGEYIESIFDKHRYDIKKIIVSGSDYIHCGNYVKTLSHKENLIVKHDIKYIYDDIRFELELDYKVGKGEVVVIFKKHKLGDCKNTSNTLM